MRKFRHAIVAAALLAGCAKPPAAATREPYLGATDALDVVLAKINANSARISTLTGSGRFDLWLNDGNSERYVNGTIDVLHTKPDLVRLRAKKLTKLAFDLGANAKLYWLDVPEAGTLWYGSVERAGDHASGLPISPTLVADVLGVATLNVDLLAAPVPTLRFNPDYDAYMITWSRQVGDRWVILREVWYDRATLEPRRVWLFDRDGRVALRAKLADFKPLSGEANADAPRTARTFDLFFPETRSRLWIRLDDMRASYKGVPNPRTYGFSPDTAEAAKRIDLDEEQPPR